MAKYEASSAEPKWAQYWQDEDIYKFDPNANGELFSIDTPPPTVSGKIHMGHIFSYTQAEVIARFKRMQGYNVFYPFGFDDNGLPTERLVEKELGIKGRDTERSEFRNRCDELTAGYRDQFRQLWQRIGLSADWGHEYSTNSETSRRISQKSFLELLEQGRIVKKSSPALWCTECGTSVAQAEIDDAELDSQFHDIKFTKEDGEDLIIATTRPELLPACVGVFVNPNDERYKSLVGQNVVTPLGESVPVLADDKVSIEKGSGAVMCCTYGDETDMYWVQKHNLPEKVIVSKDGKIEEETGEKLSIKKSREKMLARLREEGKLVESRAISHSVGTHERCGTPIEIVPVPQWYLKILDIKDDLIAAADRINWKPDYMKKRYVEWVQGLQWDWCLSRQRFFGVSVPVWYSKKTGGTILPDEDQLPVDPLVDFPNTLPEGHTREDIVPDTDMLDTWATSSLSPEINAHWGEPDDMSKTLLPMSLRPQAHDIIRTWAFYTIVKSFLHHQDIPWKDIMISGHVQAKKGQKISKSKQNTGQTPEEMIEKFSADAIRYWACGSSLGRDTMLEEQEIQTGKRLITKLWNAANFAFMNLEDFDQSEEVDETTLDTVDQWILAKTEETTAKMHQHIDDYQVGLALKEFERFFWDDFCSFYLEIVKGRIYEPDKFENGAVRRKAAQHTLYRTINAILKLIAPYLPFVTEEIFQTHIRPHQESKSIHNTTHDRKFVDKTDDQKEDADRIIQDVKQVVYEARKYKSERGIRLGAEISEITITGKEERIRKVEENTDSIQSVTKAKALRVVEGDNEDLSIEIQE